MKFGGVELDEPFKLEAKANCYIICNVQQSPASQAQLVKAEAADILQMEPLGSSGDSALLATKYPPTHAKVQKALPTLHPGETLSQTEPRTLNPG